MELPNALDLGRGGYNVTQRVRMVPDITRVTLRNSNNVAYNHAFPAFSALAATHYGGVRWAGSHESWYSMT
jgi:hypothetical protein